MWRRRELPPDDSMFGRVPDAREAAILRSISAAELGLSARARATVATLGLTSALEVAEARWAQLAVVPNCGRLTIAEYRPALLRAIAEATKRTEAVDPTDASSLEREVTALFEGLDARSTLVLQQRFGLWHGEERSLDDVAASVGVSKERVRQIELRAIERLRGSLASRRGRSALLQLRDFYLDPARCPSFAGVLSAEDVDTLFDMPDEAATIESSRVLALRLLAAIFDCDLVHFRAGLVIEGDLWFSTPAAAERFRLLEAEVRTVLASSATPLTVEELEERLGSSPVRTNPTELRRLARLVPGISLSTAAATIVDHVNGSVFGFR